MAGLDPASPRLELIGARLHRLGHELLGGLFESVGVEPVFPALTMHQETSVAPGMALSLMIGSPTGCSANDNSDDASALKKATDHVKNLRQPHSEIGGCFGSHALTDS
jgi:GMP synthase-like glutamine amidotransferase